MPRRTSISMSYFSRRLEFDELCRQLLVDRDELIKTKDNFPVFQDWVESWEEVFPAGIRLSSLDSIGGEPISS